ncbi:interferon-stimulated 20 kDa exonuclease-like 2 [Scomber japonicus]|uniref:interferon-stimulated 20 kDa exonuclease-like 2 n=1 Tax=Scomber japonicus TaxID=13676 RepID=UPI0023054DD3|nr:interferon-stimulated 20 kDa exonuclease-like 2 [Scomber japonicus]
MSDITINTTCSSDDTLVRRVPTGNRKRKNKWFLKKMRNLERKGYLEDQHQYNHQAGEPTHHQTPRQNGGFTKHPSLPASMQNKRLPHANTAAAASVGASHCSSKPSASTHSLPPLTVTVTNQGGNGKLNGPESARSITNSPSTSVASCHKPAASGSQSSSGLPTKYVAVDCEMVGTGPKGRNSQLARCSIVSYEGDVVYDKFINPSVPVTDYRTRWSGIRRRDLEKATPYAEARKEILKLLMGKVVIGHAIHNDFKVLGYSHPAVLTRDTSRIPLLNRRAGFAENECASLKRLTKAIFNRDIQTGRKGHSSVEDAKATMELYRVVEAEWERTLASKSQAS